MVERMEELWIALYERTYIGVSDLELMQLWLQALVDIGYEFPEVKKGILTGNSRYMYPEKSEQVKSDIHDGTRVDVPSL